MQNRQVNTRAFTLIELLVAMSLMLILVGAVVVVFTQSSDVVTASEAKMAVYQNARVIFDTLARDLAAVQIYAGVSTVQNFLTDNPPTVLMFNTITSWRGWSSPGGNWMESGAARVAYVLNTDANNRCRMERSISPIGATALKNPVSGLLGDYICNTGGTLRWQLEFVRKNPNVRFVDGSGTTISTTDDLPAAVRITMDLTDRNRKAVRTFSRMLWIAAGN